MQPARLPFSLYRGQIRAEICPMGHNNPLSTSLIRILDIYTFLTPYTLLTIFLCLTYSLNPLVGGDRLSR